MASSKANTTSVVSGALTIDETADYLRVCRSTLYKLLRSGDLKHAKVAGRTVIRRVDAETFLEKCLVA
ncbi:hypothetical protein GCM10007881_61300 [Mesorhizobium huakuii]|uniref:helix-turn-helix domain-containing protein n=1 Tax=Mesorhizobium huakuii TaxID=28104 RepID=UPI00235C6660|nr:helix-turn-helix domain-containing protein [Mesorhizobium huakuii]GLQ82607.1 hypothetical protein GCM10007881_61300 [Mesorhizobium huakuii]